jgi:hypothetical protein
MRGCRAIKPILIGGILVKLLIKEVLEAFHEIKGHKVVCHINFESSGFKYVFDIDLVVSYKKCKVLGKVDPFRSCYSFSVEQLLIYGRLGNFECVIDNHQVGQVVHLFFDRKVHGVVGQLDLLLFLLLIEQIIELLFEDVQLSPSNHCESGGFGLV